MIIKVKQSNKYIVLFEKDAIILSIFIHSVISAIALPPFVSRIFPKKSPAIRHDKLRISGLSNIVTERTVFTGYLSLSKWLSIIYIEVIIQILQVYVSEQCRYQIIMDLKRTPEQ